MRQLLFSSWLALVGCDAIVTDLRPDSPDDGPVALDASVNPDAFVADAGLTDAGLTDAASSDPDTGAPSSVTLVGTFEGRGGYDASGTATLRQGAEGLELVLSDDFASAAVPGPVVVVTSRSAIGTSLTAADTVVARLDGDSIRGANTFAVPLAEAPSPPFVFIYCEPFGVETARAALEAR